MSWLRGGKELGLFEGLEENLYKASGEEANANSKLGILISILRVISRRTRPKKSVNCRIFENTINRLFKIYRALQPITEEYIFCKCT